jgi:DNA segregation ATPase FtsK/SpoIIIE, S-DNA-T family
VPLTGRDPYRRYSRRQYRRARRAFRHGPPGYPYPVPWPGESPGLMISIVVARWCYRHRSAFVPFDIMAAAFLVAAMAHGHHAGDWIAVTVVTVALAGVLAVPLPLLRRHRAGRRAARVLAWAWERCGVPRMIERAWMAVVAAATGGWLAAATAAGPAARPLPKVALIATLVLGIPWWGSHRRREKVRVAQTVSWWGEVAEAIGLAGSRITSVVVDVWGWTAHVVLRRGITPAQVIAKIPEIESGLRLRPGSARVLPDPRRADRLVLRVVEKDPHAQPVPWPGPSITSIAQPVTLGLSEDGQPVQVRVLRRNVLIGGIMGAGKSGVLNVLIAALAGCPDVILWGVDLKGGMELQPWAHCLARLATTPAGATALFRDAASWLDQRAATMAASGGRLWEPTARDPALIIIVDEYAELPAAAHACADSVARRGRAVAVNLIAATQRPTQDAMGKTAVRSQMDVRICLRVRERRDVDLILGQGSFAAGWHAHQLAQPGAFLLSDPEHPAPERNRAYLITDAQVARQAARCAPARPAPGSPDETAPPPPAAGRWPRTPVNWPPNPNPAPDPRTDPDGPDAALRAALRDAGPDGVPAAQLLRVTGMSRTTLYRRLRALAQAGHAERTSYGNWRAAPPPAGGPPATGQPVTGSDQ